MLGGAIPEKEYKVGSGVDFKVPVITRQHLFSSMLILEAFLERAKAMHNTPQLTSTTLVMTSAMFLCLYPTLSWLICYNINYVDAC